MTKKKYIKLIDKSFHPVSFQQISLLIIMKLTRRVYQLFGFYLVGKDFFTIFGISGKACSRIVFLLHCIYICVNLKFQYGLQVELFKHPDIVGNTTNMVEMLLPLLCQFTIVFESFCKCKLDEKIEKLIEDVKNNLEAELTSLPLLKFIFLFVINSLIYVIAFVMAYHIYGEYKAVGSLCDDNFKQCSVFLNDSLFSKYSCETNFLFKS